jgi:protein gp37
MWVGFSSPPDFMFGHELGYAQKARKLQVDLATMQQIRASVVWGSFEPLSWDVAPYMENCGLDWVVIGAASSGPRKYQPNPEHTKHLIHTLDKQGIPIWMKDNLKWKPHRQENPTTHVKR